ncbi:MAG: two-component regulator propeller domain-containing protein, partial [Bacteroidota bacterium]
IYALVAGDAGEVWIATQHGVNKFDASTQSFHRYVHDPLDPATICHNEVRTVYRDRRGNIWVGTSPPAQEETVGGVCKLDPRTDRVIHFRHDGADPLSLSDNSVFSLIQDREGTVWVGTTDGLNALDPETGHTRRFFHQPLNPTSLSGNWIRSLMEDVEGTLWVGTFGFGLNRWKPHSGSFENYKVDSLVRGQSVLNHVHTMLELDSTTLLIEAGSKGLFLFDKRTGRFKHVEHDPQNPTSLPTNHLYSLYKDNGGTIWIATLDAGVLKVKTSSPGMRHFSRDPHNARALSHNFVRSLYEDSEGTLWVGTWQGLNAVRRSENIVRRYANMPGENSSIGHDNIIAILEDDPSTTWIATVWGLDRLDKRKGTFKHYRHDPQDATSISHNNVYALAKDEHGTLWVRTGKGLDRYDRVGDRFVRTNVEPAESRPGETSDVACVLSDRRGSIWFILGGKLRRLNIATSQVEAYTLPGEQMTLASRSMVYEDPGILWIATTEVGLIKFDIASRSVTRFGGQEWSTNAHGDFIAKSDDGYLWVASGRGIVRFDPRTGEAKHYNSRHGLRSQGYDAICVLRDGWIAAGGDRGVDLFHPKEFSISTFEPPVYVTEFRVFEEPLASLSWLPATKAINLSYDQNFFSFRFAALDFTAPEHLQYRYLLEGLDPEWVEAGTRNYAGYTNVPPGEYTFRVMGTNHHGVWSTHEASVLVIITPPWWRTPWAYGGFAIALLSILYGIRRYEMNRQRLKSRMELEHVAAEKLREVEQLKSRFFANISHEFRTPLTLIEGPAHQILDGEAPTEAKEHASLIVRNTRRLLTLVNQLLDLSKIESGQMKLHAMEVDIAEIVREIAVSFESLAKHKGVEFRIECPHESVVGRLDRDAVEKILTNLLSNAFKFTAEGGDVGITLTPSFGHPSPNFGEGMGVKVSVTDTGIGITADQLEKIFDRFYQVDASQTREQEGTGIGLALTKELVELLHGKITVESEVGKGTTFTVRLPLGIEHFKADEIVEVGEEPKLDVAGVGRRDSSTYRGEVETTLIEQGHGHADESLPLLLVVEDNPDMRKYIRAYLENEFRVEEAENGEQGVEKAVELVPDLIISDVMMPKMDGFQLCHKLKTDERTSHIPIILLTAKAGIDHKVEGLETGADDYVVKPFEAKELLARVKN